MAKLGRPGLPEAERRCVWDLWKLGHAFREISPRVGSPLGSICSILRPNGSIYFPEPRPGANVLNLAERVEIFRAWPLITLSVPLLLHWIGHRQRFAGKSTKTRDVIGTGILMLAIGRIGLAPDLRG